MFLVEEALSELQNELTYKDIYNQLLVQVECAELTIEQAKHVNEAAAIKYVVEKVEFSPVTKHLKKLRQIKDTKPDEFDGPESIKKWVDKYYDDIEEVSTMLEKEPKKLRGEEIKDMVTTMVGTIVAYVSAMAVVPTGSVFLLALTIVSLLVVYVMAIVRAIQRYVRTNHDYDAMKELTKIKEALKKLKIDKLDNEHKREISKAVQHIEDAETEIYKKSKKI